MKKNIYNLRICMHRRWCAVDYVRML